jgi:hypothetical protein
LPCIDIPASVDVMDESVIGHSAVCVVGFESDSKAIRCCERSEQRSLS